MGQDAVKIQANTFQFFARNPRGAKAKTPDEADIENLRRLLVHKGFAQIVAHAPYTLNPCSPHPRVRELAMDILTQDLALMDRLPGNLYNLHPGSRLEQSTDDAILLTAQTLNQAMRPEQKTMVLLESMAGKGSELGGDFYQLRAILDRLNRPELAGVCLDACHPSDAGYDIVHDLDGVLTEFDRIVGLHRLHAFHLNDSLNPPGSRKDRHAVLGGGTLGWEAIARIINHPALRRLPFILETPNDLAGHGNEIALLRQRRTS